jgi:hypothetical protein
VHGAHAIHRELPEAELHFLEAGHNAINDRPDEISSHIHAFLTRHATRKSETPPPSGNSKSLGTGANRIANERSSA